MCSGAYETLSETNRAEISPVLHVNTLYCITLHNKNRLSSLYLSDLNIHKINAKSGMNIVINWY